VRTRFPADNFPLFSLVGEKRLRSKKNVVKVVVAIATATMLCAFFIALLRGDISSGAILYLSPQKVEDPTLSPSSTFLINVSLFNVSSMAVCEFNLSYTPGIFVVSQLLKQPVNGQYPSVYGDVNDEQGYIYYRLTYKTPISLPEQDATLLCIEFTVMDYGFTLLDLHDTILKDSSGQPISHTAIDGSVWIIKHDIAIIGGTLPNETYAGRVVNIEVKVSNKGNIMENFTVRIFAEEQIIALLTVENLNPNETRTLCFAWGTSETNASKSPYEIRGHADIMPYEVNVTDNSCIIGNVKLKIVGDINNDDRVDLNDLAVWDSAFLSKPGDPNWNAQADINGDATVDKSDGILILENYRKTI